MKGARLLCSLDDARDCGVTAFTASIKVCRMLPMLLDWIIGFTWGCIASYNVSWPSHTWSLRTYNSTVLWEALFSLLAVLDESLCPYMERQNWCLIPCSKRVNKLVYLNYSMSHQNQWGMTISLHKWTTGCLSQMYCTVDHCDGFEDCH